MYNSCDLKHSHYKYEPNSDVSLYITLAGNTDARVEAMEEVRGGGGSGGSIMLLTYTLKGYGKLSSNGGESLQGAGSGGRLAVYFFVNETMDGFRYSV